MKFPSYALILSFFVIGFASCDLCPGERPVITFDLSANCNSAAYLNDQLSLLEQIACDLNTDWSASVELVCGDEHTFTVN